MSTSGQFQEFTVSSNGGLGGGFYGNGITPGPDGNVWYTGFNKIGKITPTGQVTEFPIFPGPTGGITKGADGNLWFFTNDGIGKFTVTDTFTDYPVSGGTHRFSSITLGPNQNVWFTETFFHLFASPPSTDLEIGQITSTGQITEYPLITGFGNLTSGGGLTAGQDGKLYLTEDNQIGVVTPNASGPPTFAQIQNPNAGSLSQYNQDITAGPDGNIWYTQQSFPAIVRLNVGGASTPALQSITVTPANPTVAKGLSQQFFATGHYSDNSARDITTSVAWASSNTSVAPISGSGVATALSVGTATIRATLGSVVGSMVLTVVSPAALESITVAPANAAVAKGLTRQLTATAHYADGSTKNVTSSVTWASSNTKVAPISRSGVATALSVGTATIRATLGGVVGSMVLTVSPAALVSITVAPANLAVAKGLTRQLTAKGTYTDKSTKIITTTVTWSSSSTGVTVSNKAGSKGLAKAVGKGKATIRAKLGNVVGSTAFTVK